MTNSITNESSRIRIVHKEMTITKAIAVSVLLLLGGCLSVLVVPTRDKADRPALTKVCAKAAARWTKPKELQVFDPHKATAFDGWSGDAQKFALTSKIQLGLEFRGPAITGQYYFENKTNRIYRVVGEVGRDGSVELREMVAKDTVNYVFHGTFDGSEIKGLWEKGDGKKAFAFWAVARLTMQD